MAGRYPDADSLAAFWDNLSQGKDSIQEVPSARWRWQDYYDPDRRKTGVHNSKWGGFLTDIDQFDPMFFKIAPLEADWIDPQERLFLQTAWAAMEDAGYAPVRAGDTHSSTDNSTQSSAHNSTHNSTHNSAHNSAQQQVGVYVGVMYNEYQLLGATASLQGHPMGFAASTASVANRVSFCLNLQGPSLSVDSMCSGSLTALHLACEDLRSGRTKMAIAGGVNLSLHPNKYWLLSKGQYISTQGHCASFGEGGDGYVPGEAVGAVILKPLAAAEQAGDAIYGVIKGSYLNHGGRSTGYSVPDPKAQQAAIEGALSQAGVQGSDIQYIEAHGTGTKLGDPIEVLGLAQALALSKGESPCYLGSVKSNIGHSESAAAIAGLTKILLQLKHQQLAPSLHSAALNPYIDFAATAFEVNQRLRPWPQPATQRPRMAGLSSFGAGGANGHMIVAEYQRPPALHLTTQATDPDHSYWLVLSARDPAGLAQVARRLMDRLTQPQPDDSLANLAFTLQVGREAMEYRAAIQLSSLTAVQHQLNALVQGDSEDWLIGSTGEAVPGLSDLKATANLKTTTDLKTKKDQALESIKQWVQGGHVDFAKEWQGVVPRPRRLHLPSYPFATQSYWVPSWAQQAPVASSQLQLSPLPTSPESPGSQGDPGDSGDSGDSDDQGCQGFMTVLREQAPWLRDHKVAGRSQLSAAAMLLMMDSAMRRIHSEPCTLSLTSVYWRRPVVVAQPSLELFIELRPVNDSFDIEIFSKRATGERLCHCQARGSCHSALETASEDNSIDIDSLKDNTWVARYSSEDLYERFRQMGLEYGPSHQGIESLRVAQKDAHIEVLAELNSSLAFPAKEGLPIGLLDSSLQAAIGTLLPIGPSEKPWVPVSLEEAQFFSVTAVPHWVQITWDSAKPKGTNLTIDLYTAAGARMLSMRGFRSSQTSQTQQPAESILHELVPVWEALQPKVRDPLNTRESQLVIGPDASTLSFLLASLPDADFVHLSGWSENDGSGNDWQLPATLTQPIDKAPWQALFWVLPPPEDLCAGKTDTVAIDQMMRTAVRLIKQLVALGYHLGPLRMTWIVEQTLCCDKEDAFSPVYAGLDGLLGSVAKEFPKWELQLLDIPQTHRSAEGWHPGLTGLIGLSGECLAFRKDRWYRRRLTAKVEGQSKSKSNKSLKSKFSGVYKDNAVYLVIGGAGGLGQVWTEHVLKHHRAQVVWVGRSPANADIQQSIHRVFQKTALSQKSAHSQKTAQNQEGVLNMPKAPVYVQADATNPDELQRIKQQVQQAYGPIKGVVQTALTLQDQSFVNLSETDFMSVFNTKARGVLALEQCFREEHSELDFLLLFSSMMSFTRQAGQSNYAAGSTFMDAYAHWLNHRWDCPVKVINWGYWGSVGSVSSAKFQQKMAQWGLGSIEAQEGMRALDVCLNSPLHQMAVLKLAPGEQMEALPIMQELLAVRSPLTVTASPPGLLALQQRVQQRLSQHKPHQVFLDSIQQDRDDNSASM